MIRFSTGWHAAVCFIVHIHRIHRAIILVSVTAPACLVQHQLLLIDVDGIGNTQFFDSKSKGQRIGVSTAHGSLCRLQDCYGKRIRRFLNALHVLLGRIARFHCCCRKAEHFLARFIVQLVKPEALSIHYFHLRFLRQLICNFRRSRTRCTIILQLPIVLRCNADIQGTVLLQLCVYLQPTRMLCAIHRHGSGNGHLIAPNGKRIDGGHILRRGNIRLVGKHFQLRRGVRHIGKFRRLGKRRSTHCKAQSQRKRKAQQFFCTVIHHVSSLCGVAAFGVGTPSVKA